MSRRLFSAGLLLVALALLPACGEESGGDSAEAGGAACAYPESGSEPAKDVEPPPSSLPEDAPDTVTIKTSAGDLQVHLAADQAPCTVNSFLSLVDQNWFDDTRCHRLTNQNIFVLQCGDPTGTGRGGPGYRFADELVAGDPRLAPCQEMTGPSGPVQVCSYGPGTVAMANSGPDTNGSQFFLVYDVSPLPADYTVFGTLDAAGLKVLRQIAAGGVVASGDTTAPQTPVTITDVKPVKKAPAD